MNASSEQGLVRQHLIDPETCIRCNTCETRCQTKAISHERNYVVDSAKCNFCMNAFAPVQQAQLTISSNLPACIQPASNWVGLNCPLMRSGNQPLRHVQVGQPTKPVH